MSDQRDPALGTDPADIDHELVTLAGLVLETGTALERHLATTLRERSGIGAAAFEVLLRLARTPAGRLRMSELSRRLDITTGGTTRMMTRLERDGLVRRRPSQSDRRVVYAEITDQGRAELDRAIGPHLEDLIEIFTQRMDRSDLGGLEQGLRALRSALFSDDA